MLKSPDVEAKWIARHSRTVFNRHRRTALAVYHTVVPARAWYR